MSFSNILNASKTQFDPDSNDNNKFKNFSLIMDFDKLYRILPKDPIKWTTSDVLTWL